MMKIAVHHFSRCVAKKSNFVKNALAAKGISVLPWADVSQSDGAIVFNIHGPARRGIRVAQKHRKKILSIQEGMFAMGWQGTVNGMRSECRMANEQKIMHFVWSKLDYDEYASAGRDKKLMRCLGNPEHDALFLPVKTTRESIGIPEDAFVIVYLEQYAHPRGGPKKQHVEQMIRDVQKLTELDKRVWVIRCLHPRHSKGNEIRYKDRILIRPFIYPIFDILKLSDIVITVSSTEGITAAILEKPIIQYDISRSPERWPFTKHGVAKRAKTRELLIEYTHLAMANKFALPRHVNYRQHYLIDGNCSERVADRAISYFRGEKMIL